MASAILVVTVLVIGSISPVLANHSTVDISIEISHAKRGILSSGSVNGAPCSGLNCFVNVDMDNDKEIKRIERICPVGVDGWRNLMGSGEVTRTITCNQGPFTVTYTATINTPHVVDNPRVFAIMI